MLVLNPQILLFSLVLGLDNDRFAMRDKCLVLTLYIYYIQHISNVTYDEY